MEDAEPRDPGGGSPGLSTCPGCGLRLPQGTAAAGDPRLEASAECLALYHEVAARGLTLPQLGPLHQLAVDAYAAQHTGAATPSITTAFALLGLHWTLDLGLAGPEVRAAHKSLADTTGTWPTFIRPTARRANGVDRVAAAPVAEHPAALEAWASAVWAEWAPVHPRVEELSAAHWPAVVRAAVGSRSG